MRSSSRTECIVLSTACSRSCEEENSTQRRRGAEIHREIRAGGGSVTTREAPALTMQRPEADTEVHEPVEPWPVPTELPRCPFAPLRYFPLPLCQSAAKRRIQRGDAEIHREIRAGRGSASVQVKLLLSPCSARKPTLKRENSWKPRSRELRPEYFAAGVIYSRVRVWTWRWC
jgi:hypothetical protein